MTSDSKSDMLQPGGELEEMWKENLKEWVYEETKVVTYKWLAKQLSVHVNVAKQMLFAFIQNQEQGEKRQGLDVIYLLAGRLLKEPKCIKVCLVKSDDLISKEAEFESLTSKHIYAVSKVCGSLMNQMNVCQVSRLRGVTYQPTDPHHLLYHVS